MDTSLIVSFIAVGVSLFTLGWQLVRSYWERPVVVVTGLRVTRNAGSGNQHVYRITAANVGERAVTLTAAGWRIGSSRDPHSGSADVIPFDEFPVRIEPYDTWVREFDEPWRPAPFRLDIPYVQIVRRPRPWSAQTHRTVYGKIDPKLTPF